MKPSDFKRWRKDLGLSQKDAADRLGLKRRMIQYYEKGDRDGQRVAVPKTVRLACYALTAGVADYDGPARRKKKAKAKMAAKPKAKPAPKPRTTAPRRRSPPAAPAAS